jgi:SAM-dependent methyltransferase
MIFEDYANFYDLLYSDKDYDGECDYVRSLIHQHAPEANKILEFGSGSGIHGRLLAQAGFEVHGVERSQTMIDLGENRCDMHSTHEPLKGSFKCFLGNCLTMKLGTDFDIALALFHVLSYQTSDDQVISMLRNAHRQLKSDGLFILDFWYAPAVWNIGPNLRVKREQNKSISITRIAEPNCDPIHNRVDVYYQNFVENLTSNEIQKVEECHEMRAFELNELEQFAILSDFELIQSEEWMSKKSPGNQTWGVCSILKKN